MYRIDDLEICIKGLEGNGTKRSFICEVTNTGSDYLELRARSDISSMHGVSGFAYKEVIELFVKLPVTDWEQDEVCFLIEIIKGLPNVDYPEQLDWYYRQNDPTLMMPSSTIRTKVATKAVTVRLSDLEII